MAAPYLTETREHRATLVLNEETNSRSVNSGCDCWRRLSISIEGRLQTGDTLYISNDGEVEGHWLIQ